MENQQRYDEISADRTVPIFFLQIVNKNCHQNCHQKLSLSFIGQVMSSYHTDEMSQRSQVSRIAPLRCSLMEVHRYVGIWVGMYVGRNFLVRSCFLITLIKRLNCLKSIMFFVCQLVKSSVTE